MPPTPAKATALIAIADGSEDLETVTLIDVLRRADIAVTVASVMAGHDVVAARGTRITADQLISNCTHQEWDLIALPGGLPGADNLATNAALAELIQQQAESGRLLAAICAAPARVFAAQGILNSREATCYPGFEQGFADVRWKNDAVVVDGNIITSRGPGTALEFSLRLVSLLRGDAIRAQIATQMLFA